MRKCCIYSRVSTDEQAAVEEGSLKNQIASCERYVEAENLKTNGRWGTLVETYVDDGYSAKSLNRPAMKTLLSDVARKRVDTIIVTELSRVSRSLRDWLDLLEFFEKHDVAVVLLRQKFETETANGRMLMRMSIAFAQLEREQTGERVKASYHERSRRGLWPGGPLPYGLDATDRNGYVQVNAAKQIIADQIFDILLHQGGRLSRTIELITETGYTRDGKPWDLQGLARWIRNRALIGELEVNAKNKDKDQERLPVVDRYQVVKGIWEPIIDNDKWLRANQLLDANYRMLKVGKWRHHEYLLTGVIECPNGRMLTGASGWGRSNKKYPYYKHQAGERRACGCNLRSIPAGKLERRVLNELLKIASDGRVVEELTRKANEEFGAAQPDYDKAILAEKQKLTSIAKKLASTTDNVLDAATADEKQMWLEKARQLNAEKGEVECEIQALTDRKAQGRSDLLRAEDIREALSRLNEDFDDLPVAAKQGLLRAILATVKVERDRVVLKIKNPGFSLGESVIPGGAHRGEELVYCKEWLLRQDSNLRPGD